jgi:hypothetical protein
MAPTQLDLFRDFLPLALRRAGMRAQMAYEIYCLANAIDPTGHSDESNEAKRLVQRIWTI